MPPEVRPTPTLAHERTRNLVSLAIAAVVAVVALLAYAVVSPVSFSDDTVALTAFVFWIGYSSALLVLTHIVFGRADSQTLRAWLTATNGPRPDTALPTSTVQWAVLAVLAVVLVLVLPGLLDDVLANVLTFAVVVTAWLVTVTAYALHYARLDTVATCVDIPGDGGDTPVFTDFYYLSAQIATTFSSSDISILTTRARATVTGQTYVAFAFSTFIIAMLISVLFLSN